MLPHERRARAAARITPMTRAEWDAMVAASAPIPAVDPKPKPAAPINHSLGAVLQYANQIAANMGPQRRRRQQERPGILYVVVADRAPGVVKIGITNNLARRVRAITTASGMLCGAAAAWRADDAVVREVESRAKYALAKRRTHGEWFRAPVDAFVRYAGKLMSGRGERIA